MNSNAIFVPINKTGCTSVIAAARSLGSISICVSRPKDVPCNEEKYIRRVDIPDQRWDTTFKFAFVRNPYDRLVSGWSNFVKNQPFKEFVKTTLSDMDVDYNEFHGHNNTFVHHFSSLMNPKYFVKTLPFSKLFLESFNMSSEIFPKLINNSPPL